MANIESSTETLEETKSNVGVKENIQEQVPKAHHNAIVEALKHNFPAEATCALFCGGKKCKYCCASCWLPENQAILGLFSHWVTDNILAMSRPTTENIERFEIIDSFKRCGIKSVFNLQKRGEHADCGNGLEGNEFSYKTQTFMDNDIYVYNFGWQDYGSAQTFPAVLDVVNVMRFAACQGKISVHCHAGLGRTGLLIACYLICTNLMPAEEAVTYVRSKRPMSIQTSLQLKFVMGFEQFLKPYRLTFSVGAIPSFTFGQFIHRQRHVLHGYEARSLKHIPKIIHVVCERLLALAGRTSVLPLTTGHDNQDSKAAENIASAEPVGLSAASRICAALAAAQQESWPTETATATSPVLERYVEELSLDGSGDAWMQLSVEEDADVLVSLLWRWLGHLKEPLVTLQDTNLLLKVVSTAGNDTTDSSAVQLDPGTLLGKLKREVAATVTYLIKVLRRLEPMAAQRKRAILLHLVSSLTHVDLSCETSGSIALGDSDDSPVVSEGGAPSQPGPADCVPKISNAEEDCLLRFFYLLLDRKDD